jgi:putative membrane protein
MARLKLLNEADLDRITEATRQAELKTSGEIVTVITSGSGSYTGHVLLAGVVALAVFSLAYLALLSPVAGFFKRFFWTFDTRQALWVLVAGQAVVFALVYGGLNLFPGLKSLVISRKDKIAKVRRRAESDFFRQRITSTKGATGVLIYVSIFERRVELLVDSSISARVPQPTWQAVVDAIIAGIRRRTFVADLCAQIVRCGEILSPDFPRRADDVNELPDRPVVE